MKTLVVGLGNPILTDDGVGVRVAIAVNQALCARQNGSTQWGADEQGEHGQAPGCPRSVTSSSASYLLGGCDDIEVTEASVGGLRLMELMVGFERVILIDALTATSEAPGTVRRMQLDDLRAISPTQHSASAHDTSLVTALDTGRRMGLALPPNQAIVIYAVAVQNVVDFGQEPTPGVAAAIPRVAAAVLAELRAAEARHETDRGPDLKAL